MRIRIDLKILIFLIIFYFTKQIRIYLIIMLFSVLHEAGHLTAGIMLKMKPQKIEIMPFGLSISFDTNSNYNKLKEIIVALAGPATSLALAILCANLNTNFTCVAKQEAVYSNLLILLFNLTPIYPLDGGRIVKGILDSKLGSDTGYKLINKISYITMVILTVISSIGVFYYKNFAIFLACVFLWIIVLKEKNGKTLDILQGK